MALHVARMVQRTTVVVGDVSWGVVLTILRASPARRHNEALFSVSLFSVSRRCSFWVATTGSVLSQPTMKIVNENLQTRIGFKLEIPYTENI